MLCPMPDYCKHPSSRNVLMNRSWWLLALAALPFGAAAQLNMYCSSPNTAWCQGMAVGFEKASGIKVLVVQKATGEMLAQVKAERANPKGDIWWAGPADSYLQAADDGLLETYRSPNVTQLYDWAQRISDLSKNQVAGVYGGILALLIPIRPRRQEGCRCRSAGDPEPARWRGHARRTRSSWPQGLAPGRALCVAVARMAFRWRCGGGSTRTARGYARSGIGPMTAVTRGEVYLGSTVPHGVINEIVRGFPVLPILPCVEGVG